MSRPLSGGRPRGRSSRIAFATWAKLPGLSDDDRLAVGPLARLGLPVEGCVWDDPRVDWGEFDAIVVRSTWDYHRHLGEFLAWTDRAEVAPRLRNSPATIRWNSHKSYLLDLERGGVPIVPTRLIGDPEAVRAVARTEGWSTVVVKAAVSAGGFRTYRIDMRAAARRPVLGAVDPPEGELLVQPYREEVERSGERSLVFLGGEYSHAFLRAPRLAAGSPLVEGTRTDPSASELSVARAAIAAAPEPTVYARVDLVRRDDGRTELMELELIEPALALGSSVGAPERFAAAIASAVGTTRPGGNQASWREEGRGRPEGASR